MKRFFIFFGILIFTSLWPQALKAGQDGYLRTVVIDPGHGGKDPGAVGKKSKEKDITLAIALKLGQYINQNFPDVKVIYTRKTDVFIELHRRAAIANENHADLFISIHCNSTRNSSAYGTETFVMGLHRSKDNLEVAKKENAAILFEDDYQETYDGFDPNSPEANIIFTLYQNAYLEQSLQAATLVQTQFRERARRHDRGVKQAGFLVLYEITMPGILIETGFLSNKKEEAYLLSEDGQSYIASAIFRAFREQKQQHDALALARLEQAAKNTVKKPQEAPSARGIKASQENADRIIFRVQFATTSQESPADAFSPLKDVEYYVHDGLYKYTVGKVHSLEEAALIQQEVQQAGYKDAFVVAFLGNNRISPGEAIRLLKQQENNP